MWAFFVGDFMAIQTVDVTVPGGDTPRSANIKLNANFSNQTHAASRLVGGAAGNVMEVGVFGLGGYRRTETTITKPSEIPKGFSANATSTDKLGIMAKAAWQDAAVFNINPWAFSGQLGGAHAQIAICGTEFFGYRSGANWNADDVFDKAGAWVQVWTSANATKDGNGFLKGASPVVDLYDNRIDLNHDAIAQGDITFEKLGVGDYLVKGSLGFAQEGWYIETPKDANGNVLVAVVYKQLGNNDLSIKTYAKKFDDETGDIIANLLKPRDIPTGRFISLRLHELPKEPPVMPTQNTSADAPAQTNNP